MLWTGTWSGKGAWFGPHRIWGTIADMNDAALKALAGRVGRVLVREGQCVATAESCTGGWIAKCLTDVAGSSDWLDCGFVAYSNEAKSRMLDVDPALVSEHGAVSGPVVEAMAEGARRHSAAQVAVAVSGVAGPGGGTPDKPVGTVWFGLAADRLLSEHRHFTGNRETIRRACVGRALGLLEEQLGRRD